MSPTARHFPFLIIFHSIRVVFTLKLEVNSPQGLTLRDYKTEHHVCKLTFDPALEKWLNYYQFGQLKRPGSINVEPRTHYLRAIL